MDIIKNSPISMISAKSIVHFTLSHSSIQSAPEVSSDSEGIDRCVALCLISTIQLGMPNWKNQILQENVQRGETVECN